MGAKKIFIYVLLTFITHNLVVYCKVRKKDVLMCFSIQQ